QPHLGQINIPAGLNDVIAIAAGRRHGLALRADGSIVAWGDNSQGQARVPAVLNILNNVAIAADRIISESYALTTDGALVRWGNSESGQNWTRGSAIAAGVGYLLELTITGTITGSGSGPPIAVLPRGLN